MNEIKNSKGITLVALIITIIVMLILVAVSVTIAIKGDLFGIAKSGAKGMTIESYREQLEAIRVNAMIEQIKKELTTEEFMGKVEEEIRANAVFDSGKIKKTSSSVKLITKEGYLFKITESAVVYMGMAEEQEGTIINLNNNNTKFILNPEGWAKEVKVSIETILDKEELEEAGGELQYTLNGGITWNAYNGPITITENGKEIKARIWKELEGKEGTHVGKTITNIDKLPPKEITLEGTSTGYSITLTGSTTDSEEETNVSGSSGIKAYYYSIDNGNTWMPNEGTLETSYTFEDLQDNTTYSTLKMKAVDNARKRDRNRSHNNSNKENTETRNRGLCRLYARYTS